MSHNKAVELVSRLHGSTKADRVDWRPTTRNDEFEVSFPRYSIRVRQKRRRGEEFDYFITILNEEGVMVEEFSDLDLAQEEFEESSAFQLMSEIHEMARRKAMGADQAIDALLKELLTSA